MGQGESTVPISTRPRHLVWSQELTTTPQWPKTTPTERAGETGKQRLQLHGHACCSGAGPSPEALALGPQNLCVQSLGHPASPSHPAH